MKDAFDSWFSDRENDPVEDDGELSPGTVIGEYRILARLGRGGFADVYRAVGRAGENVAVKILHRLDEKSRERFTRETKILVEMIRHRNFPQFLCSGSCGERPYMVLELLRSERALPSGDRAIARFLMQIISAVEKLHRHGYLHRDIKPQNILFRKDGTPVLIDFGTVAYISREKRELDGLSVEGEMKVAVGTPGYSAPEQFSGQAVGPEADIHSIGRLIYDCYQGGRIPKCWNRIYLKATASKSESRYRSVAELRTAIKLRHWKKVAWAVLAVILALFVAHETVKHVEKENAPRYFSGNSDRRPRLAR